MIDKKKRVFFFYKRANTTTITQLTQQGLLETNQNIINTKEKVLLILLTFSINKYWEYHLNIFFGVFYTDRLTVSYSSRHVFLSEYCSLEFSLSQNMCSLTPKRAKKWLNFFASIFPLP